MNAKRDFTMEIAGIYGFLRGFAFSRRALGKPIDDFRKPFEELCTMARDLIPATRAHDAGAYARCSFCGRYSIDPGTLSNKSNRVPLCECGRVGGWSGSFKAPGVDARWSFSLDYEVPSDG